MFAMLDIGIEDYNADGDGIKVKPLQKRLSNVMFSFARTLAWGQRCGGVTIANDLCEVCYIDCKQINTLTQKCNSVAGNNTLRQLAEVIVSPDIGRGQRCRAREKGTISQYYI